MSSRRGRGVEGVEGSVDVSGEVALDASSDFTERATLGEASFDVCLGVGVAAHLGHRCGVQGMVQAAVSATVEQI